MGADRFIGELDFGAGGDTKNDEARQIPIVRQLRAVLIEQRAKRQTHCPYICFRLDRRGHAVKIVGFRKAWQSRCVKLGLGRMEPATDLVTGETVCAKPRVDRPHSKPKVKMVYRGLIYHDLRRSCTRALLFAGVPEKVARRSPAQDEKHV